MMLQQRRQTAINQNHTVDPQNKGENFELFQ